MHCMALLCGPLAAQSPCTPPHLFLSIFRIAQKGQGSRLQVRGEGMGKGMTTILISPDPGSSLESGELSVPCPRPPNGALLLA